MKKSIIILLVFIFLVSATIATIYFNNQCPAELSSPAAAQAIARQGLVNFLKNPWIIKKKILH